jgi:hypothetical protein
MPHGFEHLDPLFGLQGHTIDSTDPADDNTDVHLDQANLIQHKGSSADHFVFRIELHGMFSWNNFSVVGPKDRDRKVFILVVDDAGGGNGYLLTPIVQHGQLRRTQDHQVGTYDSQ